MGQLKVIDIFAHESGRNIRGLIVNNTLQTIVDLSDLEYDYWAYPRLIQYFAATYPEGSQALVLGMGGGTLVRRLDSLRLDLDVVEIDKRISEAAVDYFGLGKGYNIIIDDARHVVRTATKNYDLIIYDAFKGESAPEHVLTQEGIAEARKAMAPGGVIFINFYGYLDGDLGLLTRSVAKTLLVSGLRVQLFATPGEPDQRNIVMAAWPEGAPCPLERKVAPGRRLPLSYLPQPLPEPDWQDALVLTDEKPQLQLFARAAMQWRLLFNQYLLQKD